MEFWYIVMGKFSFGRNPYPRMSKDEVVTKVIQNYRMDIPDNCPQNIYNLMKNCWDRDPKKRPSFEKIASQVRVPERETEL